MSRFAESFVILEVGLREEGSMDDTTMNIKPQLEKAILNGDLESVRKIFEPQDLRCNNYEGDSSLLHLAATYSTLEIVMFLVENGAELNRRGGTYEAPAVTYAAESGFTDVTRYLVESGSELDISHALRNPLLRAAVEGHTEVVSYLVEETDIDPHVSYRIPSGELINALTKAEQNGHGDIVQLLRVHGCRRPIEGVDKPVWEPPAHRMVNRTSEFDRHHQIIEYMTVRFGPVDEMGQQEILPPLEGMSISINTISPNAEHLYRVLFTSGMSDRPMTTPPRQEAWQYAELVLHLPADWPTSRSDEANLQTRWPFNWMRRMAYYPHLNNTWLGLPAAIVPSANPPEPLGPNTDQTCLLLFPDFANLGQPLQREDGKLVHFFTVVPLYTEERDYEIKHGMEAFFKRFIEAKVPMTVDVNRPSFV
ncbi:ankyrin 2,3/unc44 [Rhodopirellula maiorica SM1]|uniref:Ankyrin 2,3/unc44 n=2 Tax=Novipirellula TaxID=2795426 RepID=M5S019_9BACT|nr:ankyrin 2,3/unc44 [Rhodopirellula maiorica SM1]